MSRSSEDSNRRMLRARDAMDRSYAEPLDIARLARIAVVSEAHFIRTFRGVFGETPHRYLQRRRVERAMAALRETDLSVTEICFAVGFGSLGTFSRTFKEIVGESPAGFRKRMAGAAMAPTCFVKSWTRPSSFGEAPARAEG
jgi:AraC-like DNA-binding protein